MSVRRVPMFAVLAAATACGAHVEKQPDAYYGDGDAAIDGTDATGEGTCDFTEAADSTNGAPSTAETTSLTLASRLTMCGSIDIGHYDPGQDLVDADAFSFAIASDTDVLVHVSGAGVDTLDTVVVEVRQGGSFRGLGFVEGGHGTVALRLTAGQYTVAMGALNPGSISTAVSYQLTVVADMPNVRCPKTSIAGYTESGDGDSDNGNDVINYSATSGTPSTLTASGTDMPEASGITAAPSTAYRIQGTSAAVDPPDDYEDRDTFAFTTSATTTQMSIRLNWAATTVDFDYRVYPSTTGTPLSIGAGLAESTSEEEFQTFAVKPSTTYWLWVAAANGATGQPAAYSATLCGETFAP
jgi:hypothetical protein